MECLIGSLKLKSRVLLAPMLEPNDVAFRLLCKRAGCGLTYTGMVSPMSRQKMFLDDKPAVQLFGNSVRGIKSFMKNYDSEVALWDFNLGCPSKLSRRLGHGVFMHEDLESIEKIFRVMRASTKKPVTVKLRKSARAIEIAQLAEKVGFDAVGIHARTFGQGYSGEVDYDFALKLKKAVNVPVVFSGDVCEDNIDDILKDFDFVFVGRAAIGNPGIFGREFVFEDYLKLAKKYGLFFRQIKYQAMAFSRGLRGAKDIRRKLIDAKTVSDIEEVFDNNK
jgi:tRNA-dihydrouridine synthase B